MASLDFSSQLRRKDVDLLSKEGGKLLPRLTQEAIYLTPFTKMRVNLAMKVVNEDTIKVMRAKGGDEAQMTANYLEQVNIIFNFLLSREGHTSEMADKAIERVQTALRWFEDWHAEVQAEIDKIKAAKDMDKKTIKKLIAKKKKERLAPQTFAELRHCVNSYCDFVEGGMGFI
jgi:hypothetical protein